MWQHIWWMSWNGMKTIYMWFVLVEETKEGSKLVINPFPRMYGLVLERGGMNLATYLGDLKNSLGIIARVNILQQIVKALEFLEKCGIVHGDLKPENIVSFQISEIETCWKLIDFDNSYDLQSESLPKIYPQDSSDLCDS